MQARLRIASLLGKDCTEDPRGGEGGGRQQAAGAPRYHRTVQHPQWLAYLELLRQWRRGPKRPHGLTTLALGLISTVLRAGIRFTFFFSFR